MFFLYTGMRHLNNILANWWKVLHRCQFLTCILSEWLDLVRFDQYGSGIWPLCVRHLTNMLVYSWNCLAYWSNDYHAFKKLLAEGSSLFHLMNRPFNEWVSYQISFNEELLFYVFVSWTNISKKLWLSFFVVLS